jgi:hypothetical protein
VLGGGRRTGATEKKLKIAYVHPSRDPRLAAVNEPVNDNDKTGEVGPRIVTCCIIALFFLVSLALKPPPLSFF